MSPVFQPNVPVGFWGWFPTATPPAGWLVLNGQAVSRTLYPALFALIGTAYGAGDGSTTFNLPDMQGRSAVGLGTHADVNAIGDADANAVADRRPNAPTGGPSNTTAFTTLLGGTQAGTANHTHTPDASWLTQLPIMRAG